MKHKEPKDATQINAPKTAHPDPIERAAQSAEQNQWTIRPPEDVQRLMARAIRDAGRDKAFWIAECIRLGLQKYAGKKDNAPVVLGK